MYDMVVMFPGLDAAYEGMVPRFCEHFREAEEPIGRWSGTTGLDLMSEALDDPCARVRHRQLQVHVMNLLWWRKVAKRHPNAAVCGHGLGFYAALVAAGVIGEDCSIRLMDTVFDLSWDIWADNDCEMVVITSRQTLDLRWLLEAHELETLCANSDAQAVVYGAPDAIEALCAELGHDLVGRYRLDSRIPFHSWSMCGVSAALTRLIKRDQWHFREPERSLWSHVRARPVPDGRAAAETLAAHLRLPVRWRDTVMELRMRGASRFIEVGPNRILSQIVRWIDPNLQVVWSDELCFPRKVAAWTSFTQSTAAATKTHGSTSRKQPTRRIGLSTAA